jgi:ATP-dependent DNA helicase DinG
MTTDTVVDFDGAQDNLAASLPGYERREKQANLAHKIESQIRGEGRSRHALLQASTGTGKSLAYLIPAILSGKKVVVSTATKALQDQIANKDLPFLAEHLGVSFTHSILKGRSNYLCQAELARLGEDDPALAAKITRKLDELSTDGHGQSFPAGLYAEETDLDVTPVEFRKVTIGSGDCPGKAQCPFGETCFSEFAKADAKAAQVVVVNHALLCTDLWLDEITGGKASMLGDYEVLIVDEAHELTDYATNVWGVTLREHTLKSLGEEATTFFGKIGSKDAKEFARQNDAYAILISDLWAKLEVGRLRFTDIIELGDDLVRINSALVDMKNLVQAQGQRIDNGERDAKAVASLKGSYNRLIRRFGNATESIAALVTADEENVKFVEEETKKFRGKSQTTKVIQALPVEMGQILDRALWADNRTCRNCNGTGTEENLKVCFRCGGSGHKVNISSLLLSATLTTDGGSFDYCAKQLGLATYETFDVGTPFDFQNQAQLYIPSHLPEPTPANRETWASMSIAEIGDLINASDGRALVLFTSTKQMKAAYDHLSPRLPYTCLVQGNGTNKELARIFTEDEHSVLFATKSFMTGVDFQGSTCSLVIIDKLPFAVPTDPIVEARCELIEKRGGNTFADFQVPMMTLILQQAFGRLIRHGNDAGVVAILDRRLTTKGYGKKIVASLPDAPLATTIEEVQGFFEKVSA